MKMNKMTSCSRLLAAGFFMVMGLLLVPAIPAEAKTASDYLKSSGVSAVLESTLTADEYITLAEGGAANLYGYDNIGVCEVESGNLNVRQTASTDGKLVGKLANHGACEVISIQDNWVFMRSGEVTGYVNKDYLLTGLKARVAAKTYVQTVAISQTDGLNIREEPNTDSSILTQVCKGNEMEYVQTLEDGWVELSIDGDTAYVFAEYVDIKEVLPSAVTMKELLYDQGVSRVRVDLVEYAKQFLGNPYVWGGTSLTKGADCSGFVLSIFKHYGYKLSHSSRAQANEGTKIKRSELQPGDLIFYGNSKGTINHVAIYIGDGQVIHASSPKYGIRITKYNYRTPLKYVRIIKD